MLLLSRQCSKHLRAKGSTQLPLYPLGTGPPIQAAYLIPTIRNSHSQLMPSAILLLIPSSTKKKQPHRIATHLPSSASAGATPTAYSLPRPIFLPVGFYKLHTSVLPRLEAGSVCCTHVDQCRVDRCNGDKCRRGQNGRGSEPDTFVSGSREFV